MAKSFACLTAMKVGHGVAWAPPAIGQILGGSPCSGHDRDCAKVIRARVAKKICVKGSSVSRWPCGQAIDEQSCCLRGVPRVCPGRTICKIEVQGLRTCDPSLLASRS